MLPNTTHEPDACKYRYSEPGEFRVMALVHAAATLLATVARTGERLLADRASRYRAVQTADSQVSPRLVSLKQAWCSGSSSLK